MPKRKHEAAEREVFQDDEPLVALVDGLLKDWRAVSATAFKKPDAVLSDALLEHLILRAREVILAEPMLVPVEAPVNICGDIHGQLHDLVEIFSTGGPPPNSRYLFLGDYVDRGKHGLETISLLLALKVLYPAQIFILRGNHETEAVNRMYGFFDECKRRLPHGIKRWKQFTDLFNCLPVSALVDERALCMHGGLSPDLTNKGPQAIKQIANVKRPCRVGDDGLVCDLLWSDPDPDTETWAESDRGVSFTFGTKVVRDFLAKEDLDLIIRAHQVMENGYDFFANRGLVTVFSATSYCGEFSNCGAMLMMDENLVCKFQIFNPRHTKRLRPRGM